VPCILDKKEHEEREIIMKGLVLLFLSFIGMFLCAAALIAVREFIGVQEAIIYFILVPIIYLLLSLIYFVYFHYSTPLMTAIFFFFFTIFIDSAVAATFIEIVYAMSVSFVVTYLVGWLYFKFFRKPDETPPAF
jgi:hypothetical protein